MVRRHSRAALSLLAVLALTACKDQRHPQAKRMAGRMAGPSGLLLAASGGVGSAASQQASLAYSHAITVRVPVETFDQHYADIRDACLHDQALHCLLISASVEHTDVGGRPSAHVDVRLPHEQVSAVVARALHPLAGDKPGDVQAISQSTQADDLSRPLADATKREGELENYRDRLTELSKRPDTNARDLIQIERELAHVQAEIDGNQTSLRDMNTRIDTESLSISFQTIAADSGPASPIREALAQSGSIFIDNLADVIRFVVASLPWVPVILAGGAILRFAVRRWKQSSRFWRRSA
ncbi:DUF4349 domain-containing protein [Acetobacter malorum]|uniref:DUF4349 domain-containing protein n=1 Tax=Acetobacter malorum TaxID=178901 RepID=UPI000777E1DC|nr:DUF4349 domain-containing protein [Acetobacter malorum]